MQVLKDEDDLRCVKPCLTERLRWLHAVQPDSVSEVSEQLSSRNVFQDNVKVAWVLRKALHLYDEGVIQWAENEAFVLHVVDLFGFEDFDLF